MNDAKQPFKLKVLHNYCRAMNVAGEKTATVSWEQERELCDLYDK